MIIANDDIIKNSRFTYEIIYRQTHEGGRPLPIISETELR
jgi:hypothetical protein